MPGWLGPAAVIGGPIMTCLAFVAGRLDARRVARRDAGLDALRFGEHWRDEAAALLAENDRMRLRILDAEKQCAEQLAGLRAENKVLGDRIIQLVKTGGGAP